MVDLRFHTRGLLFLNGAELRGGGARGGGGGEGEQEPGGFRSLSFVLLFGSPTHGVNAGCAGSH